MYAPIITTLLIGDIGIIGKVSHALECREEKWPFRARISARRRAGGGSQKWMRWRGRKGLTDLAPVSDWRHTELEEKVLRNEIVRLVY